MTIPEHMREYIPSFYKGGCKPPTPNSGPVPHRTHITAHRRALSLPTVSLTLPCMFQGTALTKQRQCGCQEKLRYCDIHTTCTESVPREGVRCCTGCGDYRTMDQGDDAPVRHLLYYVYPVKGSNWRWNIGELLKRMDLFNGRRIIAVGTETTRHDLDEPGEVEALLRGHCTTIRVAHERGLGEVTAATRLWSMVRCHDGPGHYTFYGHAKGVTKGNVSPSTAVGVWVDLLYKCNLDHWNAVEQEFKTANIVGSFRRTDTSFGGRCPWHYSGTFYWVRNAALFSRTWVNPPQVYGGTEMWPAKMFAVEESACIHHDDNGPLMYHMETASVSQRTYEDGLGYRNERLDALRSVVREARVLAAPSNLHGRGIVMLGGGRYDGLSYVSLKMIRATGCGLPVKLYSNDPVSDVVRDIPGVEVLSLPPHLPFGTDKGWEWKVEAIIDSGWAEVCYIDADAYPVRDLSIGFDHMAHGHLMWRDVEWMDKRFKARLYDITDEQRSNSYSPQGGLMYMDVATMWPVLHVVRHLNDNSDYYYTNTYSDQEQFRAAMVLLGVLQQDQPPIEIRDQQVHMHELEGQLLVAHRACAKMGKGFPGHPAAMVQDYVPRDAEAFGYMNEYEALTRGNSHG